MSGLTAAKQRHVSKDMYVPHSQMSTKIMRGECNGKAGKRSFTGLDTAEPKLILYKGNARRVQKQVGKTKFYQT